MKELCVGNRFLLVFSLMFLVVMGTYAADFQVGVGGGGDFGFVFTSFDSNLPEPDKSGAEAAFKKTDETRGGVWLFLDLTYFEIDLGGKSYTTTIKQNGANLKETQSYFNIGIMGKYPFSINDRFSIFPLLGFDFQIFTKIKDTQMGVSTEVERSALSGYGIDEEYFDCTVFNFGAGLDISITKGLFFRGALIYGVNFHTEQQKDNIDTIRDAGYDASVLNHGPSIKLGLGYKF
jgi:hypothetical protein